MSRSGEYRSAREVAVALQSRGYPQAPQVLANKRIREELDRLCVEAKTGSVDDGGIRARNDQVIDVELLV